MAIILGIETSCDDTGVAIYQTDVGLMANSLYSQTDLHASYGGVVPELASRDHIKWIIPLLDNCLATANINKNAIDAIAYTCGPGLNGALLVGASIANSLAFSLNKPIIPIHHLEGHILSTFLSKDPPQPPFIALLVSGGHTQIIQVDKIGSYQLLGDTLDDAAGETFDKTAKMLGLPYPGGKYIAEYAKNGRDCYNLPRPMEHSHNLNMSFSGLKTAVLTLIKRLSYESDHNAVGLDHYNFPINAKQNIAKAIEEAITDILVKKSIAACKQTGIKNLVVSGGVSANLTLRNKFSQVAELQVFYPPLDLCTDSGAMIAVAGHARYQEAKYDYNFNVYPRFPLTEVRPISNS